MAWHRTLSRCVFGLLRRSELTEDLDEARHTVGNVAGGRHASTTTCAERSPVTGRVDGRPPGSSARRRIPHFGDAGRLRRELMQDEGVGRHRAEERNDSFRLALRVHREHLPFAVRRDPHPPPAARAARRLGAAAFEVSSAGVHAVVGSAMHPDSRAELAPWDLDGPLAADFVARQLKSSMIEQVGPRARRDVAPPLGRGRSAARPRCRSPSASASSRGWRLPSIPASCRRTRSRGRTRWWSWPGCAAGWCRRTRRATTSPTRWAAPAPRTIALRS